VVLASKPNGTLTTRSAPLAEFFEGPGRTRRAATELLVAIEIPLTLAGFVSEFYKFGTRPALDIAAISIGFGALYARKIHLSTCGWPLVPWHPPPFECGRYVIVVDDGIDVSSLEELVWATLTRSDPATSIDIIHNAWSTPLDPRIEPERKAVGDNTNSRAVIDTCRPWHWREKFPKVNMPTHEERRMAQEKFGYLFRK
jgi:hypothetical protein